MSVFVSEFSGLFAQNICMWCLPFWMGKCYGPEHLVRKIKFKFLSSQIASLKHHTDLLGWFGFWDLHIYILLCFLKNHQGKMFLA